MKQKTRIANNKLYFYRIINCGSHSQNDNGSIVDNGGQLQFSKQKKKRKNLFFFHFELLKIENSIQFSRLRNPHNHQSINIQKGKRFLFSFIISGNFSFH